MIFDVVFVVTLALAMVGAWRGCHTAWALIFGNAASCYLTAVGVPYDPIVWLLIDIAVVAAIGTSPAPFNVRDLAVVLLFLPAWALLLSNDIWAVRATDLIVSVQFLLVTPWVWIRERVQALRDGSAHPGNNGWSRVAHV